MIVPNKLRLKNTIKYPTSIIIGGLNKLGLEIADSLIKQGGYVVIIDTVTTENIAAFDNFADGDLISFLDYTAIPHLEDDIRRLDYIFYFGHEAGNYRAEVSTQEFLTFSNYLDATLSLAVKFDSRFLLTTSIKANQILFSSESHIGNDFGLGSKLTKTYTEMEVQRYAEGLVMEYHEKIGLNTRITRLGEIIGDGMDLGTGSTFVRLITQAINGQNLTLTKDGLESEWFVQIFDAVYALIKAQFSKDTNGKVYSIAYENTYTHLSIAYKIQEVEENAKEIQFVEEDNNLPPIKIHNPAPNLATIGWMPRVSFDKAVRQSIGAAKMYFMEKNLKNDSSLNTEPLPKQASDSFGSKLKSFLKIADSGKNTPSSIKTETPVDKLLEQKRIEAQEKQARMNRAGTTLKLKRQRRKLSIWQKFQNKFWATFIRLANSFSFLKKFSPAQLAVWTFFISIFLVFYFILISPLLVITRAGLLIYPEINNLETNLESSNLTSLDENVSQIASNMKDLESALDGLKKFTGLISLEDEREKLVNLINYYNIYFSGLENIDYALEGFKDYQENYQHNLEFVASSSSYLVTTSEGLNYDPYLQKLESRKAYLIAGIEDIKQARELIEFADLSILPGRIQVQVAELNKSLINFAEDIEEITLLQNLDQLLGATSPKTYLVLVLDNSKPAPVGGQISAYALFTISNGSIQDIEVKSANALSTNFKTISEADLELLNQRSYVAKATTNLNLQSLTNISDFESFASISETVLANNFDREIDFVTTININGLETLLESLNSNVSEKIVSLSNLNGDLLTKINSAQTGNETIAAKNEIIAQLLALTVNDLFLNLNNEFNFIGSFTDLLKNKNLQFDTSNLDIDSLAFENTNNPDTFVSVGLTLNDSKVINVERYSQVSLDLESTIREDSVNQSLVVTFPNIGATQDISICLPLSTQVSSIKPLVNASTQFTINSGLTDICIVSQILSETSVGFEWKMPHQKDEDFTIEVHKIAGVNMQLNQTIKFEGLEVRSSDPILDLSQDPIRIVKNMLEDEVIEFKF
jgi:nucleoside-diphosphate-sugar epimerase